MSTGAKYWRFQYSFNGKRPRIALGVYPDVGLAEARELRAKHRKQVRDGLDPAHQRKKDALKRHIHASGTLEKMTREWHEVKRSGWSPGHAHDVIARFERDIFPQLGNIPIAQIDPQDVLVVIRQIEARGAPELARRALQNIGRVCRYAIATGRADRDPTFRLTEALKPIRPSHYAALDPDDLPEFVVRLRSNDARLYPVTLLATELLMLTFVRTGELIGARWDEFDLAESRWLIPGERMKMGKAHIVPLSRQALKILKQLQRQFGHREFVFPHSRDPRRHMTKNTILKAIERMGYKGRMTGHGFRALAMSAIKEKLGYRHEVVDRQLAHAPVSKVDRAYDRARFLDDRKQMMQDWADYIDKCHVDGVKDAL